MHLSTPHRRLGATALAVGAVAVSLMFAAPAHAAGSLRGPNDPDPSMIVRTAPRLAAATTHPVPCRDNGPTKAMSRADAVTRARSWLGVTPYSQEACYTNQYGDYRTDCSGMVSMAWGLGGAGSQWWTGNLDDVSTPIAAADLQPGDALLYSVGNQHLDHVALFERWSDAAHTEPVVIQETGSADNTIEGVPTNFDWKTYTPIRYDNIYDSLHSVAVGDLNDDGKKDVVGLRPNGDVYFQSNTGAGNGITWGSGWTVVGQSGFTQIAVGDLNNDGRNDLIGLKPNGDLQLLANAGGGNGITWGSSWTVVAASGFTQFDVGDLNNDGKVDVVGRKADGAVVLLPNQGGGNGVTWGTAFTVIGGSPYDYISVGDLNNDGKTDLVGRKANGDLVLQTNTGAGNGVSWGSSWTVVAGSGADTFDVGDLNNDGKVDLTYRQSSTGNVNFLPNTGAGNGVTWSAGWTVIGQSTF